MSTKDWEAGTWQDHPLDHPVTTSDIPTDGDLYFSPHLFTDNRRIRRNSAPTGRWLYADLDEVDPRKVTPTPTISWETSPGRYQCLWLLDRPIPRRRLEQLNQRMTYHTGADKGGWSLTKVLRVPGSVSTKRDTPHRVHLIQLPNPNHAHSVTDLTELLREVDTSGITSSAAGPAPHETDLPKFTVVWRRRKRQMTARARQLINTSTVLNSDDRSARMWELETSLLQSGLKPVEVFVLVRATVWNKYSGQRRESEMLWREIGKAAATMAPTTKRKATSKKRVKGLLPGTMSYDDFMRKDWERPTWLVDKIWTAGAYGILAGEYKSFKTMLLLDLALSVASGEPFLGKYQVVEPGQVEYIHEEGRHWSIHDRMHRVGYMKGITDNVDPDSDIIEFRGRYLPLNVVSLPRLNLRDPDSQSKLTDHIEVTKPKLVILETFYLLSGGATESAIEEVSPMLEYLAGLSHEHGCAVILSHHFHKSSDDRRFLDRVAGSNIFGRWYESGMFVERHGKEEDNTIQVMSHHRDGSAQQQRLQLVWGSDDDSYFDINHLPFDDDEDEAAANTIVDLGQTSYEAVDPTMRGLSVNSWLKHIGDDRVKELIAEAKTIGRPVLLGNLRKRWGAGTTDQAKYIVQRAGLKVETHDHRRYAVPSSN